MEKITPEKTHALLEKLAEYVMNEVPTRREMKQRFEGIDKRFDGIDQRLDGVDQRLNGMDLRFEGIEQKFKGVDRQFGRIDERLDRMALQLDRLQQEKADKADVVEIKKQLNTLMTNMDKLVGDVHIPRTEQKAFDAALQRLEKRIDDIEAQSTGYRVRDKKD